MCLSESVCVCDLPVLVSMLLRLLWLLLLLGDAPAAGTGVRLSDCLVDDDYEQLLQAVRAGLPPVNTSHHVVVVGAGVAGLTAAKLLQDAGHRVDEAEGRGGEGGACGPEGVFLQKSTADVFTFICVSMATR